MAQQHKGTEFDRYPAQFDAVRQRVAEWRGSDLGGAALRILSFGCSTGEELRTIRLYFPQAEIFGCDIDLSLAADRADLPGKIFFSSPENIASHGPFDVIFANSALCLHPVPEGSTISQLFPFREFLELFGMLHDNLKQDGIICAYNTSYLFRDLPYATEYRAIRSDAMKSNGFLPVFDKTGIKLVHRSKKEMHVLDRWAVKNEDLQDCVFQKSGTPDEQSKFAVHMQPPKLQWMKSVQRGLHRLMHAKARA